MAPIRRNVTLRSALPYSMDFLTMPDGLHDEIAGAGIGCLTAATALALRGWTVRVHEQAPELRDIGVGTSIWANGHHVLAAIGALDQVLQAGTRIVRIEVRDNQNRLL